MNQDWESIYDDVERELISEGATLTFAECRVIHLGIQAAYEAGVKSNRGETK